MSEVAEAPPQTDDATAGALLRRAREASGLHVAALAVSLKVPVRKLEALEDDRFAELGDAVFVRALASSVCRTLKVDAQPVLAKLPQTSTPRLIRDSDGLNAPFRAPGDGPAPSWFDTVRQPVPLAVLALVIGAAVIWFLPMPHLEENSVASLPAPAQMPSAAPAAFVPAPSTPAPSPVEVAAPAPAPATAAAPDASAVGNSASPAGPASGVVVLRTRGTSWVEVVDAKGVVALRKNMTAGESAGASGALPLIVTVGKVDVTDVEVRGKKFDMKPVSKDNVARFEVR